MSSLVFFMDYGPLLNRAFKSAFIVYSYYDMFKNDEGVVQITYNELNEHLGLASSTINNANVILIKLGLIEEVEGPIKKFKLLPIQPLTKEKKQEILLLTKVDDYEDNSSLKRKYVEDNIPPEYNQFLNKKILRQAQKEIGSLTKMKSLCKNLSMDYNTFKLIYEKNSNFKSKFKLLCQQVEQEAEQKLEQVKKVGEQERELVTYLYDKLSVLGAKPIQKSWFMKNCNTAKNILVKVSLEEAKEVLDWGFNDSWWQDKITSLVQLETVYQKYKLTQKKKVTINRTDLLPELIRRKIQQEASIQVHTYEDAAFLKQSVLDGQENEEIKKVVRILEISNILPSGIDNIKFG